MSIRFIHAARDAQQVALRADITQAAQHLSDYADAFFYEIHDDSSIDNEFTGLMDLERVSLAGLPAKTGYYLCGPLAFMRVQRQWLQAQGVSSERIHYEVFGPDLFAGLQ